MSCFDVLIDKLLVPLSGVLVIPFYKNLVN